MTSTPMRILIAEDETIIRLDLRELLERSGFEVVAEARDGEEAVALARSESRAGMSSARGCRCSWSMANLRLWDDGVAGGGRAGTEGPYPSVSSTTLINERRESRA